MAHRSGNPIRNSTPLTRLPHCPTKLPLNRHTHFPTKLQARPASESRHVQFYEWLGRLRH